MLVPPLGWAYFLLIPIVGVFWAYQLDDQVVLTLKPVERVDAPANDSPRC